MRGHDSERVGEWKVVLDMGVVRGKREPQRRVRNVCVGACVYACVRLSLTCVTSAWKGDRDVPLLVAAFQVLSHSCSSSGDRLAGASTMPP